MNSFNDLNNYAATLVEYIDSRPSGATFDRAEITYFNPITFTSTSYASIPSGINIEEVRNYSTANLTIVFTIESREIDPLVGASLTWASVPSGVSIATSGNRYTITGVNTKAKWDAIKNPTWLVPANYATKFGWYINVDINFLNSSLGFQTYTYIVFDERYYYDIRMLSVLTSSVSVKRLRGITQTLASTATIYARPRVEPFGAPATFNYTSGNTQTITGVPAFVDGNTATWTVTVTPSRTLPINTISTTGTGGTFSFNASTKVVTIVGTPSQVSSRLQGLTLNSVVNQDYDFDLVYYAVNEFNESDSATQRLTSVNFTYLSSVSDDTFTTGALESIFAPTITHSAYTGIGTYTLDVYTDTGSNLTTIASDQSAANLAFQTGTTFSGTNARAMQVNKNENRMTTQNPFFGGSPYSRGSVKIYSASGLTWTEDVEFSGSAGDNMGPNAISATGSRIAIGLPGNVSNKGLVNVYDKVGTTWTGNYALTSTTLGTTSQIGSSISISEDGLIIAAGAPYYSPPSFSNSGGVIIWRWNGTSWVESNITNPTPTVDMLFGNKVQLSPDGNYIAIEGTASSNQKCYVFFWNGTTWNLQKAFTDGAPTSRNLTTFNSDATAIVEYFATAEAATNVTARYWKRTGTSWSNVDTITYYRESDKHVPKLSYDGRHLLITETNGSAYDVKVYKLYTNTFYYQTTISVPYWPFPGNNGGWTFSNRVYMIDSITDVNPTTQTWVYKFYNLGITAVNYTTNPVGNSWNNTTKTFRFSGEKAEINGVVGTMKVTAAATANFQLIYKLTTPTAVIVYRSQRLTRN